MPVLKAIVRQSDLTHAAVTPASAWYYLQVEPILFLQGKQIVTKQYQQ